MSHPNKNSKAERKVCCCNSVSYKTVEDAIEEDGCDSLGKIFDKTLAGVGACGGSCQPLLRKMLKTYQATGKFPVLPQIPNAKKVCR